jgi:murein DD-endopeptidase MepM/ murein hydrolase activator NlpD
LFLRALTAVVLAAAVSSVASPALARSELESSIARRATISTTITRLRERRADTTVALRHAIGRTTRRIQQMPPSATSNRLRFRHVRAILLQERRALTRRLRRTERLVARRVSALRADRRSIGSWIATWGVFRHCPIAGAHVVSDNFGITVRLPDVPVHRHMGNDIVAAAGTPIVAPFDGYASASSSELGGLEVRVEGSAGYVYNAHLSSYGTLGQVRAGTVIGYVGDTGDATTAHDHLEWHPGGGSAVDPYPYLAVSCG